MRLTGRQGARPASPGDGRWSGAFLRFGAPDGPTVFNTDVAFAASKKTGEWQTVEMAVVGTHMAAKINGISVTGAENITPATGHLVLQCEQGDTDFRSILIREEHAG